MEQAGEAQSCCWAGQRVGAGPGQEAGGVAAVPAAPASVRAAGRRRADQAAEVGRYWGGEGGVGP